MVRKHESDWSIIIIGGQIAEREFLIKQSHIYWSLITPFIDTNNTIQSKMAAIKSVRMKKLKKINLMEIVTLIAVFCCSIVGLLYFLHAKTRSHILQALQESFESGKQRDKYSGGSKNSESQKQYHMVFSTSCSPFQDWQSILFFYFAWKVKQTGTVTRIASGCNDSEAERLRQVHREQIEVLSANFKLHITPDFNFSGDTKYFNKPFGIRHWMENALGYPEGATEHDDAIIMILDPDMMLLRPLTHTFYDYPSRIWRPNDFREIKMEVTHGWPMASTYGFSSAWQSSVGKLENLKRVVGEGSPSLNVSVKEADQLYPAGPPYLATARDMYSIVKLWTVHVIKYYEVFPFFMSEMYAYCTAASHLGLRHQLSIGFMVSDTKVRNSEGWGFLDDVSRADSCEPKIPQNELPVVFHFCQRYGLGRWFVGKYKLPEDFFTCEAPMLRVPPRDVGSQFDWYIFPNLQDKENFTMKNDTNGIKYNSYSLCTMIDSLNEAASHYKKHHCKGDTGNYDKSFVFFKDEDFAMFLAHPELEVVNTSHPGR